MKKIVVLTSYLIVLGLLLLPAKYPVPYGEVDAAWHYQEMEWIISNEEIPSQRPDKSLIKLFDKNAYNYPPSFHALTAVIQIYSRIRTPNSLNILSGILVSTGFLFIYALANHVFKDWRLGIIAGFLGMTTYRFLYGFLWGQLPHALGIVLSPLTIYLFYKRKELFWLMTGLSWYLSPLATIFVYLVTLPLSKSKEEFLKTILIPTMIGLPIILVSASSWGGKVLGQGKNVSANPAWIVTGIPEGIVKQLTGFPTSHLNPYYTLGLPLIITSIIGLISLWGSSKKKFFLSLILAQFVVPRILSGLWVSEYPFRMQHGPEALVLALITTHLGTLGEEKKKRIILLALATLCAYQVWRAGLLMNHFYAAEPPWVGRMDDVRFTSQTVEALKFIENNTGVNDNFSVIGFVSETEIAWMQAITNRTVCYQDIRYPGECDSSDYFLVTYDSYAYTRPELKRIIQEREKEVYNQSKPLFVNELTGVYSNK